MEQLNDFLEPEVNEQGQNQQNEPIAENVDEDVQVGGNFGKENINLFVYKLFVRRFIKMILIHSTR